MSDGIGRVGAFRARMAGAVARRDNQPAKACPHDLNGSWRERTLGRYWLRGWVRADAVLRAPSNPTARQ